MITFNKTKKYDWLCWEKKNPEISKTHSLFKLCMNVRFVMARNVCLEITKIMKINICIDKIILAVYVALLSTQRYCTGLPWSGTCNLSDRVLYRCRITIWFLTWSKVYRQNTKGNTVVLIDS